MKRSFWIILAIAIIICFIGIISIYSSTYQKEGKIWQLSFKRQIAWVFMGMILFLIMANFNYRKLWDLAYFLYGLSLFLLVLVFILGIIRLGAQRWLKLVWFNFQPSELAKLTTIILLARYFSKKSINNIISYSKEKKIFKALFLPAIIMALPVALIIEQPDLGSGLIILFVFMAMLFYSGIRFRYLALFFLGGLSLLPMFWQFLHGYQKKRIWVFLNPNIDPLGAGYTVIQSKIAIGSGGFLGKGWLSGTQSQLYFLPEAHTDFIFATFSEQWGILGSMILFALYFFLIRQGFLIAQHTSDEFGKNLAFGITMMITLQFFINIAMNLGMTPVVGLPLPLMSYGGSSTIITFISLGILANINKERAVF